MSDEKRAATQTAAHNLILENRERLSITGVRDVDTFDETKVILFTDEDTLEIDGYDLHISKLNIENGEVAIQGEIATVAYTGKNVAGKKGLWSRMFR